MPHLSLDWLYEGFAWVLIHIHALLGRVIDPDSGLAWGLSIVILTALVRLVIFPLFVKQIRSQRAMSALQPQLKELQTKYKGDKQKLQEEMMKLYKENGANPLSGCLPIIAQAPFLFAMYHVMDAISHDRAKYGITADLVDSASHAKIFGVPIATQFRDSAERLSSLGADPIWSKVVILALVIVMAVTTFIAQRQLMVKQNAQQAAAGQETPFQQQQKIMLFIFPAMFLIWGFFFPMGLIVYWTTSNLWTMGQQYWVLHRMPHKAAPGVAAPADGKAGGSQAKATGTRPATGATAGGTKAGTRTSGNGTARAGSSRPATGAGSTSPGDAVSRMFRRRKAEPEPAPAAPAPQVVRRQQPARKPRSQRSGVRKK